jgi:hypothetical protein
VIPERHDWGSRFLKWRQHQELQWRLIAPTAILVLAELSDFISLYEHYNAIYPLGELSARRLAGRRHALGALKTWTSWPRLPDLAVLYESEGKVCRE